MNITGGGHDNIYEEPHDINLLMARIHRYEEILQKNIDKRNQDMVVDIQNSIPVYRLRTDKDPPPLDLSKPVLPISFREMNPELFADLPNINNKSVINNNNNNTNTPTQFSRKLSKTRKLSKLRRNYK